MGSDPVHASRALKFTATFILACIAIVSFVVLPPAPRYVNRTSDPDPLVIKGAVHVHTIRSDGGGTVDDVASAAAAVGIKFVIITDHGDGRGLDPPSYRSGVLVMDGAEVSTAQGHVLALGARPAEYPLGGEARDVIDDIHRLGGIAVVAHPDSAKPDLAWRAWDAPYDGIEWLNGDSEWRDETANSLARLALGYWFRPAAAVAGTFDRHEAVLERADAVAAKRAIVLLAGHDAHARIGGGTEETPGGRSVPFPSYRSVFGSFAIRAELDTPLTGRAGDDGAIVLRAIRHGRMFTALDGLAPANRFTFSIRSGGAVANTGDRLIPAGPLGIEVVADAPDAARIVVLGNGREVASGLAPRLEAQLPSLPGPYRVEVRLADGPGEPPVPWIVSNHIFVGLPPPVPEPVPASESVITALATPDTADEWAVEHSAESEGVTSVSREDGSALFTFGLGQTRALSPYAALVRRVQLSDALIVEFRVHADRPMRVSVQLRSPQGGGEGRRWRRSIYADTEDRLVRLSLADFVAVPPVTAGPELSTIDSLLFVVDTINTDPGRRGEFWIADLRLVR